MGQSTVQKAVDNQGKTGYCNDFMHDRTLLELKVSRYSCMILINLCSLLF